jgi:hypothetical protein
MAPNEHGLSERRRAFLSCLPAELLVMILWYTHIHDPKRLDLKFFWKEFNNISATCRRVREIALACPKLWAYLDCEADDRWQQLCIARSQDYPLSIVYLERINLKDGSSPLLQTEILARSMHIAWRPCFDSQAFRELSSVLHSRMPLLRKFRLDFIGSKSTIHLNPDNLGEWTTGLTSFSLKGAAIPYNLSFPALRKLTLEYCNTTVVALTYLLHHVPALKVLSIRNSSYSTPSIYSLPNNAHAGTSQHSLSLPALHTLHARVEKDECWELFWLIPNPSHTFTISTYQMTAVRAQQLHARFLSWSLQTGVQLPPITILMRRCNPGQDIQIELGMGKHVSSSCPTKTPSIYWQNSSSTYSDNNVFFPSKTVRVVVEARGEVFALWRLQRIFNGLEYLEELCIRQVGSIQGFAELKQWIRSLAEEDRPLKTLTFERCSSKLISIVDEIREDGMVNTVTWAGSKHPRRRS